MTRARTSGETTDRSEAVTTLSRIKLPPLRPPTIAEIERRRALYARARALREEIGPIGVRTDDLIHQVRCEADADDC